MRADLVAASASIWARSPSRPVGEGAALPATGSDEGSELGAIGGGIAFEEEVLHRIGAEALRRWRSRRSSRGCCRPSACPSSRAPRCAGRSRRWRGANSRSARGARSPSPSARRRCRRRRPRVQIELCTGPHQVGFLAGGGSRPVLVISRQYTDFLASADSRRKRLRPVALWAVPRMMAA